MRVVQPEGQVDSPESIGPFAANRKVIPATRDGGGHSTPRLNLEAHPEAVVRLAGQRPRLVRARPAAGEERDRLWQRWVAVDPRLDAFAGLRSTETPVVILEPRDETA
jgi:hypothetical protein